MIFYRHTTKTIQIKRLHHCSLDSYLTCFLKEHSNRSKSFNVLIRFGLKMFITYFRIFLKNQQLYYFDKHQVEKIYSNLIGFLNHDIIFVLFHQNIWLTRQKRKAYNHSSFLRTQYDFGAFSFFMTYSWFFLIQLHSNSYDY